MSGSLFRPEVVDAKRSSWLGGVSLLQPLRTWWLAVLAMCAATTLLMFLLLGQYTKRSRVTGELVPDLGLSTVVAPTGGVVNRLYPQEGAQVASDQPLMVIGIPRVTAAGSDSLAVIRDGLATRQKSLAALSNAQGQQIDTQVAGLQRQRAAALRELAQIENEIATRSEQVRLGRETTQRYQRVADEKYVSQVQLNQQQQSVLEMTNALQALERQSTGLRRNLAQLDQALAELPAQRASLLAAASRDRALLAQEGTQQEANGELMLRSPVTGLVANRLIEAGQAVQPGQPLMTLLPRGSRLQAQLRVPSAAVGFIEPGDVVLLRYQAFPYQKFGHHRGRVLRVSRSALSSGEGQSSEAYYRVLVALDQQSITAFGKPEPLRPGMRLEADILGERRRLYEWVLEPLYSLGGKLAH